MLVQNNIPASVHKCHDQIRTHIPMINHQNLNSTLLYHDTLPLNLIKINNIDEDVDYFCESTLNCQFVTN